MLLHRGSGWQPVKDMIIISNSYQHTNALVSTLLFWDWNMEFHI